MLYRLPAICSSSSASSSMDSSRESGGADLLDDLALTRTSPLATPMPNMPTDFLTLNSGFKTRHRRSSHFCFIVARFLQDTHLYGRIEKKNHHVEQWTMGRFLIIDCSFQLTRLHTKLVLLIAVGLHSARTAIATSRASFPRFIVAIVQRSIVGVTLLGTGI